MIVHLNNFTFPSNAQYKIQEMFSNPIIYSYLNPSCFIIIIIISIGLVQEKP